LCCVMRHQNTGNVLYTGITTMLLTGDSLHLTFLIVQQNIS
jgi:hypothetical protein